MTKKPTIATRLATTRWLLRTPDSLSRGSATLILEEQCDARQRDAGCKHEPAKRAPVDPSPNGDPADLNAQP